MRGGVTAPCLEERGMGRKRRQLVLRASKYCYVVTALGHRAQGEGGAFTAREKGAVPAARCQFSGE